MGKIKGWKKTQDTTSNTKYGKNRVEVWKHKTTPTSIQHKRVLISTTFRPKSSKVLTSYVDISLVTGKVQMPSVQRPFDTRKEAFEYAMNYMRANPNG